MSYRVAVAVSGRGSNMLALGDVLDRGTDAEIVGVFSDRDAPGLAAAAGRGWPTTRLGNHRDAGELLRLLDQCRADLLVLSGYLRLIPAEVVEKFRGRIINIHPALLPKHGGPGMYGARVHAAVLSAGDSESGATVHLADEEYDRGMTLGQARVPVLQTDTIESLAERVLEVEHRLLPAAVLAAARAGGPTKFDLT